MKRAAKDAVLASYLEELASSSVRGGEPDE
jgi:hypothetical protein